MGTIPLVGMGRSGNTSERGINPQGCCFPSRRPSGIEENQFPMLLGIHLVKYRFLVYPVGFLQGGKKKE